MSSQIRIGSARTLHVGERTVETGIIKSPVEAITIHAEGAEGDAVMNTKHHGGPDQAVYVYSAKDYAFWEEQLGRSLDPGMFGENLTVSETPELVRTGDRMTIGDVVLEVTSPRIPCATFAARMREPGWIRRFRDAKPPGFYCRVLEPGTVRPGDRVQWAAAPEGHISLGEMVEHFYASDVPLPDVRRAIESPIAIRSRAEYETRLEGRVS
jgi:MOSC domain-containing protein YiiM